jgi:hypothetical protein
VEAVAEAVEAIAGNANWRSNLGDTIEGWGTLEYNGGSKGPSHGSVAGSILSGLLSNSIHSARGHPAACRHLVESGAGTIGQSSLAQEWGNDSKGGEIALHGLP